MAESIQPQVSGDPNVALIAQLNRFRKSAKQAEYPLITNQAIPLGAAIDTITLLQTRAIAATLQDPNAGEVVKELTIALGNPLAYVSPRATMLAQQLALYGDSLGLTPAKVGITRSDPNFHPKWDAWMYLSVLGALGIGAMLAGVVAHRMRHTMSYKAA